MKIEKGSETAILIANAIEQYIYFLNCQVSEQVNKLAYKNNFIELENVVALFNEKIVELNLIRSQMFEKENNYDVNIIDSKFNSDDIPFWESTIMKKTYVFEDLIHQMKVGQKVSHGDFLDGEYITIKDGYFVDENGKDFSIAPWFFYDYNFYI